jgi:hypothetical protein
MEINIVKFRETESRVVAVRVWWDEVGKTGK